ncbi:hypothetical protein JOC85_002644 [Bacillus mesophilus]|uniref:YrhK domain-containing protein n=1 Tax=Bacillus mesophilus TaxID=1808955 RepID=A0A6M0QB71_9BACI|nr:YrhK family protein [Bacillus mesophilus]MBM7661837.1 hypothetical protein [Bacillus mesophilus]NEY72800.1 hypothetical protein [Bacillus mesophilus]
MIKKLKNRTTLDEKTIQIQLRKKKIIINNRYRLIYYLNNIVQGFLYMIGSILFLLEVNRVISISCFLVGSILMVTRSLIHIVRDIHLMKFDKKET